jgi:hypothetical protein
MRHHELSDFCQGTEVPKIVNQFADYCINSTTRKFSEVFLRVCLEE